ncbi:acyl-CoA dehydrogenase family protein [Devosia ginsengisoli]|uniref:acyl-CoA dehydrogenase family protein n=1 Tax=Devosia ginsengisoli TaxID=400770 RepID=UPI001AED2EB9|nr:acyl-CoA dehydrogenase family protein [Devosia ginsengisoli]
MSISGARVIPEPNAGSDLASLRTEAVRDGDAFVINGSKIWTTMAHHATHMFLLARTNKAVKKQEGISFFVLDLKTSGVTIRPIGNLAGHEEFCEVFFDEVRVPADNLIGELDKGWSVAKSLLGFERLNNGSPRRVQGPLKLLQQVADARSLALDPVYREKYTAIYLDITDLKSAYSRFSDIVGNGLMPGPEISQLKIWAGECAQRLSELLIETAGEEGGHCRPASFRQRRYRCPCPVLRNVPVADRVGLKRHPAQRAGTACARTAEVAVRPVYPRFANEDSCCRQTRRRSECAGARAPGRAGGRTHQRQDGHESVRRNCRRRGAAAQGDWQGRGGGAGFHRSGAGQ